MTTFMEPETIDIPIEIVDTAECTKGYAWCTDEDFAEDGNLHLGDYASIAAVRWVSGEWAEEFATLHARYDESDTDPQGLVLISDGPVGFTARQARIAAAHLLNAADELDPLPTGVVVTSAAKLRIGDELLTDDGWQQVIGLIFFADTEQAHAFTPERHQDCGPGWDFSFNDPVKVRRHLTGSCAIQFVEPIR